MLLAKFPSISGLENVVKAVEAYPHIAPDVVSYRGKNKLHGMCAAVRMNGKEIMAQSKEVALTPTSDLKGFAKWVDANKDSFLTMKANDGQEVTIFGEWCGPGIANGTAIQQIPHKVFAVFAIMYGIRPNLEDEIDLTTTFISEPSLIEDLLTGSLPRPAELHILPWYGEAFEMNVKDKSTLAEQVARLNALIEAIEPCDPWVKATFGIEGVAEGIVYYPQWQGVGLRKTFSDLSFKAKGKKHQVKVRKDPVQIDPEVAKSIAEFVDMFVTPGRLEQGVQSIGGICDPKLTGAFLKWISTDIIKESADELEVSNLEWNDVAKAVQTAARIWFIAKSKILIEA